MRSLIVIAFAAIGIMFSSCISDTDDDGEELISFVAVGDSLPHFSVAMSDSSIYVSSMADSGVSVITFFNTSCKDCQHELPILNDAYIRSTNVRYVCISRGEAESSILSFWTQHGLSLPYSSQTDTSVYNLFATNIIPRIYIVKQGIVVKTYDDHSMPTANQILEITQQ